MEILIGTKNQGKLKEFENFFADSKIKLRSLQDFPNIIDVAETGKTYAENAILKATTYSLITKLWTIADDSGLEVESLNNKPGIYSSRYGGNNASDNEKIQKILNELKNTNGDNRNANFISVIALTDEKGEVKTVVKGICKGQISTKPIGINGFGYDAIFIPNDFNKTFGELSEQIKQTISHRAKAIEKIIDFLHL